MLFFEAIGDFIGSITDWMNDNLDGAGLIGAFLGVGAAFLACIIWG